MKLQFEENEYYLCKDGSRHVYATTDESYIAELGAQKLSRVNCEAMKNGYDLDELVYEEFQQFDQEARIVYRRQLQESLATMFNKALSILGDKKFSEDDLREAISQTRKGMLYNKQYEDEHIQSLQQTEWDVVVEMDIDNPCPKCGEKDNVHGNYDYSNITRPLINTLCNECGTYFSPIPKLDAENCLILKRK